MSDFVRAVDHAIAQLDVKTRTKMMAEVVRVAREYGYTNIAVDFDEDGHRRGIGCPRWRVFIDHEKATMHMGVHPEVANVDDVHGISFYTSDMIAKEHLKIKWGETERGEPLLSLEPRTNPRGIIDFDVTPDNHFALEEKPTFEDARVVSFKFSEWDSRSEDRHKCTVFIHQKERFSCTGSSKEEVYRSAVERSRQLMKH